MYKTNHAYLIKRLRMDRNEIRSGDKIQNGGGHKFCRLMSCLVIQPPAMEYLALLAGLLLLSAWLQCQ